MITQIIKENEKLIGIIAMKYKIRGYDQDDKVNLGRVVCWKCHKKYSRTKGNSAKFSTYLISALNKQYSQVSRDVYKRNDGPIMNSVVYVDNINKIDSLIEPDMTWEIDFGEDIKKLFPNETHQQIINMLGRGYNIKEVQDVIKVNDKRYINRTSLDRELNKIRKVLARYFQRKV